ncbi:MAG TPA: hypothetical protein VMF30_00625 [Pirellulales bacterium]|nr:hypothetical protein [Pirellulales bacterium]
MVEGFSNDLVFQSCVMALLATLIAWQNMPLILAAPAALLRVGFCLWYFGAVFDGTWTLIDDLNYFNDSASILRDGFDPLSVLFTIDGAELLSNAAGGRHFLYQWYNLVAMYLFGEHYYAAVLMNVLATFGIGFFLSRTLKLLGFSRNYRIGLELFYLFHWDVITWSSFINLKEIVVQLLTVASLYSIVRFLKCRDWISVVGFLATVQLFYWVRFYLPVLILFAVLVWGLWQWRDQRKFLLVPVALGAVYVALHTAGEAVSFLEPTHFIHGLSLVLLSPLPWVQFEDVFWFIAIPAAIHLLFFLPALYGAWQLWKTSSVARLFLFYLAILLCFYGAVEFDGFRGPRQRSQMAFIFAWMQFQFLCSMRPAPAAKAATTARPTPGLPQAPRRRLVPAA